jgi:hypothetical protein
MDPAAIGAAVIAVLTPYAKKALENFAGKAGELALEKTMQLSSWLKDKLSGDSYAKKTFERFEDEPDKYGPILEDVVRDTAEADAEFANQVAQHLDEIEKAGTSVRVVQQILIARKKVTGVDAGDVVDADISVDQTIDEAGDDVVGARLGSIGASPETPEKKTDR